MTFMSLFPYLVGLLDLAAALVYLKNGQIALFIVWFCYAIAAAALGSVQPSHPQ